MKYIKILIVLAIILLLFWYFFKNVDMEDVAIHLKNLNPLYPVVFLLGHFLQYFIRAYRWGILLKPYKEKIPLRTLYHFTIIGFFLNLILGRVGEPARGILLAREVNIKKSYGLASVVLERMIDILFMVLLFLFSLWCMKGSDTGFLLQLRKISLIVLPLVIFVFSLFYLINIERVFSFVNKIVLFLVRVFPRRYRQRITDFSMNFLKGLKLELGFTDSLKLIGSSFLVWAWIVPFFWILMKGFGIHIHLIEAVPFFAIVAVFASIPIPGMAGTLDLGSKEGLIKLYQIAPDTAAAYTIVFHFLVVVLVVSLGIFSLKSYNLNLKTVKEDIKQ